MTSRVVTSVLLSLALAACRSPQPAAVAADRAPPPAPVAPATTLAYVERVTGGASSEERLPMIVAIHGLGDTPEAFVGVFDGLPARARVIAVRGIDAWSGGWSWFHPDLDPASAAFARAVELAADRIAASIIEIERTRPTCGRLVITGFSQGGMLSYTLAARHRDLRAAYFPIAGRLPAESAIEPGPRAIAIHGLHGTADPRVPIDAARASIARSSLAGLDARLEEYPGVGHTITDEMRGDLFRFVAEAVRGGCDIVR